MCCQLQETVVTGWSDLWVEVTWLSEVGCGVFGRWKGDEHHRNVPQHLLSAQSGVLLHP